MGAPDWGDAIPLGVAVSQGVPPRDVRLWDRLFVSASLILRAGTHLVISSAHRPANFRPWETDSLLGTERALVNKRRPLSQLLEVALSTATAVLH